MAHISPAWLCDHLSSTGWVIGASIGTGCLAIFIMAVLPSRASFAIMPSWSSKALWALTWQAYTRLRRPYLTELLLKNILLTSGFMLALTVCYEWQAVCGPQWMADTDQYYSGSFDWYDTAAGFIGAIFVIMLAFPAWRHSVSLARASRQELSDRLARLESR